MIFLNLDRRLATVVRLVGLGLVTWTVLHSHHYRKAAGRGALIGVALAACLIAWLIWTARPSMRHGLTPGIYALAICGAVLLGASPDSAASAFVFVAIVAAGLRAGLAESARPVALAILALAGSAIVFDDSALGVLAYSLGFAAALLASTNVRQSIERADQAELLLAQTQRSHEEQLRSARLEESTRIAREIHDVLAHTLAGLVIQLEATASLIEQGTDPPAVLERVRRAHELAREGLSETRRAVGALRGEDLPAAVTIGSLVQQYRAGGERSAELVIAGDSGRLAGPAGEAVLRVAQEALTNVRKHAPGSDVTVTLDAGASAADALVLIVEDRPNGAGPSPSAAGLAGTGGGFGLRGMRERAQLLGGTLTAGPVPGGGWRVELRLPGTAAAAPR